MPNNLFPEDTNFEETNTEDLEEPLEFRGSYLFDFEKGEFVKNPDGTIAKANDLQAYVQWCNKALLSPRYRLAYSDLYGQEFNNIMGKDISRSAIELEIKRITKETLMVHPRSKDLGNFKFSWEENRVVHYEFEIKTIDEEKFILNNTLEMG